MRVSRVFSIHITAWLGLAVLAFSLNVVGCAEEPEPSGPSVSSDPIELTFPFDDPDIVYEIHNFALHPWSADGETHSGIDIVPEYLDLAGTGGMRKVAIIAPADGTIAMSVADTSGAGLYSRAVIIQVNTYWHLFMVIEPQSADGGTTAEQAASFEVAVGQTVSRGDKLGDLVVSKVAADRYPHLHFGVLYKDQAESWNDVFASLRVSDGSNVSPKILNVDRSSPSTFYCPYDYFLDAGKAIVDGVPRLDMAGNECSCACSYGSSEGDCGRCP